MSGIPTSSSHKKSSHARKIPVFVFPEELKFVEEDQSSHKQVLTLYNPYDFNIRFEVFSNAPKRYTVLESKGSIRAHCCMDILVRHLAIGLGEELYNVKDKFRIDIYYDKRMIGSKMIPSTLIKEETRKDIPKQRNSSEGVRMYGTAAPNRQTAATGSGGSGEHSRGLLLVAMALVCLLVLLLPLEGEGLTWPSYLHITVNQKLIASFALGLVIMAILKS